MLTGFRKGSIRSAAVLVFVLFATVANAQTEFYNLFIGTYTRGGSEGVYVYRLNTHNGDLQPLSIAKGFSNPSFLSISPNGRFLYTLGGSKGDTVRAFAIDDSLRLLNAQSLGVSSGASYVLTDPSGRWLLTANYGSGSITVLSILANGSLGDVTQTVQLSGKSIIPERQDKPHVHCVRFSPDGQYLFATDLGTDKIMAYRFDAMHGLLTAAAVPSTNVTPGSGPRHLIFHPNGKFAYVIQELNATITAFSYADGVLHAIETVQTLPADYNGRKWAADIHISPDGKFLYGSNRAHESLVIFRIDQKTGHLKSAGHQPVFGKTPRNFNIDPTGNYILVANQDSDNITVFKRNKRTGKLKFTGKEIKISQPVCLMFLQ